VTVRDLVIKSIASKTLGNKAELHSIAPEGLPPVPPHSSDRDFLVARARRTQKTLIAEQRLSKSTPSSSPVTIVTIGDLPPLPAELVGKTSTTPSTTVVTKLRPALLVVKSMLHTYSASELDGLLQGCDEDEREILLGSLMI